MRTMILKAVSSRAETGIDDLNEDFTKAVYYPDNYLFTGEFTLHDEKTDKVLANVSGYFIDEDKIINEGVDIVEIADVLDTDLYYAMIALSKSEIHNQELSLEKMSLPLFSCYIERIYVYPRYRKTGMNLAHTVRQISQTNFNHSDHYSLPSRLFLSTCRKIHKTGMVVCSHLWFECALCKAKDATAQPTITNHPPAFSGFLLKAAV